MKTITFEQVEPALHKWAGILENNRFEHWELINSAWLYGKVRLLPSSKIKYASARIRYDMIDYMRNELKSRRRRQRETRGIKYKHLPYMNNFSDMECFFDNGKRMNMDDDAFEINCEKLKGLEEKDFFDYIINSMYMTKIEKIIIKLCYLEDFTQKEIGKVCGCSESRISQLHKRIMERLKEKDFSKAI